MRPQACHYPTWRRGCEAQVFLLFVVGSCTVSYAQRLTPCRRHRRCNGRRNRVLGGKQQRFVRVIPAAVLIVVLIWSCYLSCCFLQIRALSGRCLSVRYLRSRTSTPPRPSVFTLWLRSCFAKATAILGSRAGQGLDTEKTGLCCAVCCSECDREHDSRMRLALLSAEHVGRAVPGLPAPPRAAVPRSHTGGPVHSCVLHPLTVSSR